AMSLRAWPAPGIPCTCRNSPAIAAARRSSRPRPGSIGMRAWRSSTGSCARPATRWLSVACRWERPWRFTTRPGIRATWLPWLVKQVKREVGQVQQPTLIVHPREDDRASLRNLEYLQTNLGGLIEAVVLDDSYHIVTLDRQRQLVVDRTLEFISQVGRSAAST